MTRLDARWSHFWARNRVYRHFWTATNVTFAAGDTITAGVSLIPGQATGSASAFGETLGVTITLLPGTTATDAAAPLNLRLNARYRHFWGRRRTERHFWAQYEGDGIGPAFADGQLVVSSVAVIVTGDVSGDANQDGATMTVDTSMVDGVVELIHGGQTLTVAASLIGGEATGDAVAPGALLIANLSLVAGTATVLGTKRRRGVGTVTERRKKGDAVAPGALIEASVTLVPGVALGDLTEDEMAADEDLLLMIAADIF